MTWCRRDGGCVRTTFRHGEHVLDESNPGGCRCTPQQLLGACVHADMCGSRKLPTWLLNLRGGLCQVCYFVLGEPLTVRENVDESVCGVCQESTPCVVDWASGCGHSFCLDCTRSMIFTHKIKLCPLCRSQRSSGIQLWGPPTL
jgi:hypothetical protein